MHHCYIDNTGNMKHYRNMKKKKMACICFQGIYKTARDKYHLKKSFYYRQRNRKWKRISPKMAN